MHRASEVRRFMKIVVVSADYPGPDRLYGEGFVHARVKAYQKEHDVQVIGYQPALKQDRVFVHEGVQVSITRSRELFYKRLDRTPFDLVVVHFIQHHFAEYLLSRTFPVVIFLHGYESLSWKRRLMNYNSIGAIRYLIPLIKWNRLQLNALHALVTKSNAENNIHFVFVSDWLRKTVSTDIATAVRRATIIPNGIDTERFVFHPRAPEMRNRILLLRSFKGRNYANDIAIDAIHLLSRKKIFLDLQFAIYGEGYLFPLLTDSLRRFSNVQLNNFFVPNSDIPAIHRDFGVFLCPSRLDTQGVSMGEAMSSGLVPVTTGIGGIIEYSEDNVSALYGSTPQEIADCIERLYRDPELFLRMSVAARVFVEEKCSIRNTVAHELSLFSKVIAGQVSR